MKPLPNPSGVKITYQPKHPTPPMQLGRMLTMAEMLLNKATIDPAIRSYVLRNVLSLSLAVLRRGDIRVLAIFNGYQPMSEGQSPQAMFTPLEPLPGICVAMSTVLAPTLLKAGYNWTFCPETL